MKYITYEEQPNYKVAILIKDSSFKKEDIKKNYVDNINTNNIIAFNLKYNENNKAPVKLIKEYITNLLKVCKKLKIDTLLVADGSYFKVLTGVNKTDNQYGYILPCKFDDSIKVILTINYQSLFYNPSLVSKLNLSIQTLNNHVLGKSSNIGKNIIHSKHIPNTLQEIEQSLNSLHSYNKITCDIETFDLKHFRSGIGTIAFAWDQHNGIAFNVDCEPLSEELDGIHNKRIFNKEVRKLLKKFFEEYTGKLIFHNISFDVTILIYQLWMKDILDTEGLYTGLDILTRDFDCTQTIIYLATNSCAGNKLSLKENAHEFAGNYAVEDIHNILNIPNDKLLTYNLVDCLSTWYVHNKYYPKMIKDDQEDIYLGLMKESLITIIQMQLTGMPICMDTVLKVEKELTDNSNKLLDYILKEQVVKDSLEEIKLKFLNKDFNDRKNKAKNPSKIKPKLLQNIQLDFNPNSSAHLTILFYNIMGLPVIETTDTGLPSTDDKTLNNLISHTNNDNYKRLIQSILDLGKISKILTTFIPAFKDAQLGPDGNYYLFGSYKLGGTISGRLSSSSPNLQQTPSGSTYGKLTKTCFKVNKKWLFCGADFSSLEDRINTLLTKDPNKEKVYLEGYDGHCLRAYSYYIEQLPDILDNVKSINSIKNKYPEIRQDSKAPTFALTYGGTYFTLIKNCGFTKDKAKQIEARYHALYKVSDQWVYNKLKQASIDGYVTLAFGLKLRTPILKQVIWDSPQMPREASQEGRSAGNAVSGQSYGLLNCRAANELRKRIRNSPYKYDIKLSSQIHDAIYLFCKNNVEIVQWLNNNLVECMSFQDLEEIKHDQIKLEAEMDIYYPDWSNPITLPNKVSVEKIVDICRNDR